MIEVLILKRGSIWSYKDALVNDRNGNHDVLGWIKMNHDPGF